MDSVRSPDISGTDIQSAILDALPAHIALVDARGTITSVNKAWRQFGDANGLHSPGHEVGVDYVAICDSARGDDAILAHQAAAGIRSVLAGTSPSYSLEYPCHSPAMQRWFALTVAPLVDGHPSGAVVMHVDITERKRTEDDLRQSENRKSTILNASLDCIITIDHEGKIVEFNAAAEATFGLPSEQAIGKIMVDLIVPPRFRHAHVRGFARYLATGDGPALGRRLELAAIRADGSEFPIELTITAIPGTGKPMFTGFIRDITEHKVASNQLDESDRRFRDMLDNVDLASVMLDREGRITYCNDYLLRLTDWQLEDVLGNDWFELFIPPECGDMHPAFEELLANSPASRHRENEIRTRSGELRRMRWSNSVLRSGNGEVIGTASVGEDITQRKLAEEVLVQHTVELERFHRLSVGRELQMIELKKQINEMARQAGRPLPHDLAFLDTRSANASPGNATSF